MSWGWGYLIGLGVGTLVTNVIWILATVTAR